MPFKSVEEPYGHVDVTRKELPRDRRKADPALEIVAYSTRRNAAWRVDGA